MTPLSPVLSRFADWIWFIEVGVGYDPPHLSWVDSQTLGVIYRGWSQLWPPPLSRVDSQPLGVIYRGWSRVWPPPLSRVLICSCKSLGESLESPISCGLTPREHIQTLITTQDRWGGCILLNTSSLCRGQTQNIQFWTVSWLNHSSRFSSIRYFAPSIGLRQRCSGWTGAGRRACYWLCV